MKTVYILTAGDYSDYHIIGVYSTRELAEKAQFLYEYSRIEEYSLDRIPDAPPNMKAWELFLSDEEGISCYPSNPDGDVPYENYFTTNKGILTASYRVWATDEDHARKIAQDQWYQHKAQLAGIS